MKKILVTGVTGFIGRNLFDALQTQADCLYLLRHSENIDFIPKQQRIDLNENLNGRLQFFKPEVVLHLATYYTFLHDPIEIKKLISANLEFGTMLLEALKHCKIQAFINFGSFSESYKTACPANLYSATKLAFKEILKYYQSIYNFKLVDLILYNVYGKRYSNRKKIIDLIAASADSTEALALSPGEQEWDFIHVSDVVDIVLGLIGKIEGMEFFSRIEIGTGTGIKIKTLPDLLSKVLAIKPYVQIGARAYRDHEIMLAVADLKELNRILGLKKFLTLEEGLRRDFAKT